jgi:hypothetical protein
MADPKVIYDESLVPEYTLPDPLVMEDGTPVAMLTTTSILFGCLLTVLVLLRIAMEQSYVDTLSPLW